MGLYQELGELFIVRAILLRSIKKLQVLPLTTQEQGIRADFAARSILDLHRESTPSPRARTSAGRTKGLVIPYWIRFKIVKEGSRQHAIENLPACPPTFGCAEAFPYGSLARLNEAVVALFRQAKIDAYFSSDVYPDKALRDFVNYPRLLHVGQG